MSVSSKAVQWQRVACSIKGTSHVAAGLPMQDSMRGWPEGTRPASVAAVAVCDGHGNRKHFRSSLGGQIGAELATKTLSKWATKLRDTQMTENVASVVSKKIAAEIHQTWEKRVAQHAECEPFERRRLSKLNEREQKLLKVAPQVAYGATCLSAVLTEDWGLLCRLGDGVIALCDEAGSVTLPFNEAEKSSQRTASLSSPNAAAEFETRYLDLSLGLPGFILVASDGLPDAVGGVRKFMGIVGNLGEELRSRGIEGFAEWFRRYIDKVSDNLFDDTTVAFLVRSDFSGHEGASDVQ